MLLQGKRSSKVNCTFREKHRNAPGSRRDQKAIYRVHERSLVVWNKEHPVSG